MSLKQQLESLRLVMGLVATTILGFGALILFIVLWKFRYDPVLTCFIARNFAAIIGLPAVAVASMIVVTLFRQSEQPIEFQGLGFRFKGASGEIVLWVLCFIAMSTAVHFIWFDQPSVCKDLQDVLERSRSMRLAH